MEDTEAAKIRYIYQGLKNICESATCASCNLGSLAGKAAPPCIIYKVTLLILLTASCTFLFRSVFRVRDTLYRIRILGSVQWIAAPDLAPDRLFLAVTFKIPTKRVFYIISYFLIISLQR
jgi:hypothetical protein